MARCYDPGREAPLIDLAERAVRANRDIYREAVLRSGGRVVETDGICFTLGRHPSPIIANNAFRIDPSLEATAFVAGVATRFEGLRRRPVLTTFEGPDGDIDAELRTSTWTEAIELPVMVRRTPLPEAPESGGTTLRWLDATVPADLDDLREVLRRGFAEDDEEREIMESLFNGPASIAGPGAAAAILTLAGRPAACAMVYRVGDEAVVGWVATVPEARGRGLGGHITTALTNRGFGLGATFVTLQASPMGLPVYVRLGYETIMSSRIWVAPEAA